MTTTYRPSLTLPEIQFILQHIPERGDEPDQAITTDAIRRKLEVFTLKAQHGITLPSHIRTGRASLESQLGLAEDTTIEILFDAYNDPIKRRALSKTQLARITHHRYLSDMMSPEEEVAYEKTL